MATIGLSKPYFAVYSNSGSTVTYSNGGVLGKATEMDIELNDSASNILYADNAPAETDSQFSGGTVTITTDELSATAMTKALAMQEIAIAVTDVTTTGAKWLINNDDQVVPYVGIGGIAKKMISGSIKYVAIVLDKVKLRNINMAITTQGESIEWQTPSITGDIFRSDLTKHDWRRISTPLDTEAEAEAAVKAYLGIS